MAEPNRKIIHVDMDAFYASVEQRDAPELRGLPVAVGGSPNGRGVIAAASYEARAFGVRSAMPSARALRLCPDLVFVRPQFAKYKAVSQQLHEIFRDYTDLIEPLSLDEAYLDVTENKQGLATATDVAKAIRARVAAELELTCSAGVSSLKFVAKIASDTRKPNGLTVVPPHRVLEFIHPLPLRKLWGVGPATEKRLTERGLHTIGQLAALPMPKARTLLGERGLYLWRMAQGVDNRGVRTERKRKSRSAEHTFSEDVVALSELDETIDRHAERICKPLRDAQLPGRTVVLKLRYDDFTTITRSQTLENPTHSEERVAEVAKALLRKTEAGERPVRLIGVGLSGFDTEDDAQLDLFTELYSRQESSKKP